MKFNFKFRKKLIIKKGVINIKHIIHEITNRDCCNIHITTHNHTMLSFFEIYMFTYIIILVNSNYKWNIFHDKMFKNVSYTLSQSLSEYTANTAITVVLYSVRLRRSTRNAKRNIEQQQLQQHLNKRRKKKKYIINKRWIEFLYKFSLEL